MPFSASTCLSYLGTTPIGLTLKVYTNPISPTVPGTFLMDVSTLLITGGVCPYTFIVPDATTTIRLFDPESFCYVDIPISNNNVCTTCNLNFTSISNNLLSTINVGSLAGTCDSTITDYRISWYGPNNSTQLAFTSGAGTIWPIRDATQPITPSSPDAPFLEPGTYVSKITDVELNGTRFSYSGGTNNVLSPSLLNCSNAVTVAPYTCINGVTPPIDGYYAHRKTYTTDGSSPPKSANAEILLTAGLPAFIWSFNAFSVYDTITLTFYGSSYPNPIVLEDLRMGALSTTDLRPTTFPKLYSNTQEFKKVTILTGLTVNNNDKIKIVVTPNPDPLNATSWDLKFGCRTTAPTASKTCLDAYKNSPYKILKSSIIAGTPDICGNVSIQYQVRGCSSLDNSPFLNSDLVKLTTTVGQSTSTEFYNNTTKLSPNLGYLYFRPLLSSTGTFSNGLTSVCTSSGANTRTITIEKSNVNFFTIFCSDLTDMNAFETSFISRRNYAINPPSRPAYDSDSTNINYYRFFAFTHFTNTGNYICGDGTTYKNWYLHVSSTYVITPVSGGYLMTIQTPLITFNYPCTVCIANCTTMNSTYLTSSNGCNTLRNSTFSYTNTSGLRYTNPFDTSIGHVLTTTPPITSRDDTGYFSFQPEYASTTYASTSDGTNTLLPALSGVSWDWQNHFAVNPNSDMFNRTYLQTVFSYSIVVLTFTPLRFQIKANPIVNFLATNPQVIIYDSDFPNTYDANYIYV